MQSLDEARCPSPTRRARPPLLRTERRRRFVKMIHNGIEYDPMQAYAEARFRSREKSDFGNKVLSAMRRQFGGHVEPKDC